MKIEIQFQFLEQIFVFFFVTENSFQGTQFRRHIILNVLVYTNSFTIHDYIVKNMFSFRRVIYRNGHD